MGKESLHAYVQVNTPDLYARRMQTNVLCLNLAEMVVASINNQDFCVLVSQDTQAISVKRRYFGYKINDLEN